MRSRRRSRSTRSGRAPPANRNGARRRRHARRSRRSRGRRSSVASCRAPVRTAWPMPRARSRGASEIRTRRSRTCSAESAPLKMRAVSLVRSLGSLAARDVALAGGKGANLGELARAGFPVPDGFVLTTEAYEIASRAVGVDHADPQAAAERLRGAPVPAPIADAARQAYRDLGGGRVAVRSSATAEDLPGASFAGQQDTFLDVAGEDALLDAIRRSWASLFNDRAVAYRRANGIDEASVALAVVVQRMVDATAAGVLFTADPVTGERRRTAIDAIAGLGDALVSGRVNPDHYVVRSGAIVDRRGRVLDDASILALAATGERVERHFAAPQDIEFAFDRSGALWLLQSRPITTLYPLPVGAPDPDRDLRVYFSANVAQGMFEPFTPMGVQTFRLISASFAKVLRRPLSDPVTGAPPIIVRALARPNATRERVLREVDALVREQAAIAPGTAAERVDAFQRMFVDTPGQMFPKLVSLVLPGVLSFSLVSRLLRRVAREDELRIVLRGLPHNPTTEMDLALWALARDARDDPRSRGVIAAQTPA